MRKAQPTFLRHSSLPSNIQKQHSPPWKFEKWLNPSLKKFSRQYSISHTLQIARQQIILFKLAVPQNSNKEILHFYTMSWSHRFQKRRNATGYYTGTRQNSTSRRCISFIHRITVSKIVKALTAALLLKPLLSRSAISLCKTLILLQQVPLPECIATYQTRHAFNHSTTRSP